MAQSINARLRKLWLNIHLWIGVGLGLALIPVALSGALLVWHEPMEHALYAKRFDVTPVLAELPPSTYLAAAEEAFAGRAKATTLRLPEEAGMPVTVVGRMPGPLVGGRPRQLTAWLDPASADVKDVADASKGVFSIMHRLHGSLMIPNIGRKVVGWLGWAMVVSCLTGLWLWWPRNGAWKRAFAWRRTPMTLDNLHHMIGFWICIPLLILSLTGVYISFPQTSRALFGVAPPPGAQGGGGPAAGRARAAPPAPLPFSITPIDRAIAAAHVVHPGRPTVITLPTEGRKPAWKIQMARVGDAPAASVEVVDATGAAALEKGRPAGRAGQDPTSRLMRQIHDGVDTPPIWQLFVFLGGIAPVILAVTGVWMWLAKRARKARLRA